MVPVTHRVPVPLPVIEALISLALQLSWKRWAAVSAICFFGISRAGEVLRCRRKDLLLPSDLLQDAGGAAYVVLWQPKTSQRQAASVQHLKITESSSVSLLEYAYRGVSADESLYPGTPAVYRRRWNHLLSVLGIPRSLHLTPAGMRALRGGGSLEAYRNNVPTSEIQWRMRLTNLSTLEAYLQEVAGLSLLTKLSSEVLHSVRCCPRLFRSQFSV